MSKIAIKGAETGTGVFTLESPATNTDRTLVLPDEAGTVLTSASPVVLPKGVPAFYAYTNTSQTLTHSVNTKLTFASEEFDSNSFFDATTSVFQPTIAGYYWLHCFFGGAVPQSGYVAWTAWIAKNGSTYPLSAGGTTNTVVQSVNALAWGGLGVSASNLIYFNGSTDYAEAFAYFYDYSTGTSKNAIEKRFMGYLVGAA